MKESETNKLTKMNNDRRFAREEQWTSTGCVELRLRDGYVGEDAVLQICYIHVENIAVKSVE